MPKFDYKIDYRAMTAAHYTTYSMSPQARAAVARNENRFINIAEQAMATVKNQAIAKSRDALFGAKVNILA